MNARFAGICGIVAVGDELLAGAHPDLNSPWLAARLGECGIRVQRVLVVGDDEADIAAAVREASSGAEFVFVSGGLGPTLDDVTRHGVARALGAELCVDEVSWREIQSYFERAGRPVTPSNKRQALLPEGATRIPNDFGTAPGFRAEHPEGATVVVLPGPPRELQGVFEAELAAWLAARPTDGLARAVAVATFVDLPESRFADVVGAWMDRDANPLVGVTVKEGILTARCVGRAETMGEARSLAESRANGLVELFPEHYLGGELEHGLGHFVGTELCRLGVPFTLAESCTGGLVASAVMDAPGLSAVLSTTFVTYADAAKIELLGVSPEVIAREGAVSEACVRAMALGAIERTGARIAVSISGIAGPGGGREGKPVGLVWFGVAIRGPEGSIETRASERRWAPSGRRRIRRSAANRALMLLLEAAREAATS